jgi:site-specific DNA recombinase
MQQLTAKQGQLKDITAKIERLEERLINDEIEVDTYKKYYRKFQAEKALLSSEIGLLDNSVSDKINRQLALLPLLINIPAIYDRATLNQKHSLLHGVFKHGLSYSEGAFRTPYITPALRHNLLKMNKKGLLFLEQPSSEFNRIPSCAEEGTRTPTPRGARS